MKKLAATLLAIVTLLSCRNSRAAEYEAPGKVVPMPTPEIRKRLLRQRILKRKVRKMPLDKRIALAEKRLTLMEQRLGKVTAEDLKAKLETAITRRKEKLAKWKTRLEEIKSKKIKPMPVVVVAVEETEIIPEGALVTVEGALEKVPEVLESEVQEVLPPEEVPADITEETALVTVD